MKTVLAIVVTTFILATASTQAQAAKFRSDGCHFSDYNAKAMATNAAVRKCGKQGYVYRVSNWEVSFLPGSPKWCNPSDITCIPDYDPDSYCAWAMFSCTK